MQRTKRSRRRVARRRLVRRRHGACAIQPPTRAKSSLAPPRRSAAPSAFRRSNDAPARLRARPVSRRRQPDHDRADGAREDDDHHGLRARHRSRERPHARAREAVARVRVRRGGDDGRAARSTRRSTATSRSTSRPAVPLGVFRSEVATRRRMELLANPIVAVRAALDSRSRVANRRTEGAATLVDVTTAAGDTFTLAVTTADGLAALGAVGRARTRTSAT